MPPMNAADAQRVGVAILARAPIAGQAKTRLIPHLGAAGAAALQRWLLRRTVTAAIAADVGPVILWCTPEPDHPEFAACAALGPLELRRQPDGDLGRRMHGAVAEASAEGGTLVIGTDCPELSPALLRQAADSLRLRQAIVIPAEDGGYVLIGLRQPAWQVFAAVDWGSERVMEQTRARLNSLHWNWSEFSPLWDVDRAEDFVRLATRFPETCAFADHPPN